MNWQVFSTVGYVSIAAWGCMPLLWLWQRLQRRRRWLCHVALALGIVATVLAKVNSTAHVARIEIDRSEQIAEQMRRQTSRMAMARKAATEARAAEVAPVRFAEDDARDHLDEAGMDEADLKYMRSFDKAATPAWKTRKQARSAGGDDDSLEARIGAAADAEGVESAGVFEESSGPAPIVMSERDRMLADRLDAANRTTVRVLLCIAVVLLATDYLRRVNIPAQAYWPLPVPSRWADAFTPAPVVREAPAGGASALRDELRTLIRRGDSFVYMTDDAEAAGAVPRRLSRLPLGLWTVEVLSVADAAAPLDDDFVFESLWYGRASFVVDSGQRAERMVARFVERLAERRATRAAARQAVHIVWDLATPVPAPLRDRFAALGGATRFGLLLRRDVDATEYGKSS